MSTGDSQLTICNTAIIALGRDPVLSISPPENKAAAIWAAQFYDPTRRAILEGAAWNCAKRQAQLSAVTLTDTITNAANNGAGLIRLTLAAPDTQLFTGLLATVTGVTGTTEANGGWVITVVDTSHIDLQNSAFVNAYAGGGSAQTLVKPLFTYSNAYPLPSDFIRFFDLPEDEHARWELLSLPGNGRNLATNVGGPIDITYVFDLQDPTQMDPLLVEAIGYSLAAQLAIPLGCDGATKDRMEQEKETRLQLARTASAQQKSARHWGEDRLMRSRC